MPSPARPEMAARACMQFTFSLRNGAAISAGLSSMYASSVVYVLDASVAVQDHCRFHNISLSFIAKLSALAYITGTKALFIIAAQYNYITQMRSLRFTQCNS